MRDGVKLAFAWQYDTRDQTDNLSEDEALVRIDALLGDMRRMQGIIHAMTPAEREKPELIKATRKRRIAAGAGMNNGNTWTQEEEHHTHTRAC